MQFLLKKAIFKPKNTISVIRSDKICRLVYILYSKRTLLEYLAALGKEILNIIYFG